MPRHVLRDRMYSYAEFWTAGHVLYLYRNVIKKPLLRNARAPHAHKLENAEEVHDDLMAVAGAGKLEELGLEGGCEAFFEMHNDVFERQDGSDRHAGHF